MTVHQSRTWKEAGVQQKAWIEPLLRRFDPTPELLDFWNRGVGPHESFPPERVV